MQIATGRQSHRMLYFMVIIGGLCLPCPARRPSGHGIHGSQQGRYFLCQRGGHINRYPVDPLSSPAARFKQVAVDRQDFHALRELEAALRKHVERLNAILPAAYDKKEQRQE